MTRSVLRNIMNRIFKAHNITGYCLSFDNHAAGFRSGVCDMKLNIQFSRITKRHYPKKCLKNHTTGYKAQNYPHYK